jgi:hypothetical protein
LRPDGPEPVGEHRRGDRKPAVLWALKNAREAGWLGGDIGRWKALIAAVLAERDGARALTALFRYIVQTNPTVKREVLRGLLPGDGGTEVEEAVMNCSSRRSIKGVGTASAEGSARVAGRSCSSSSGGGSAICRPPSSLGSRRRRCRSSTRGRSAS